MPDPIRVLVVDDQAIVRAGVRTVLASADDIVLVGEAWIATDAIALAGSTRPDVVVMDLSLGRPEGIAATRILTYGPRAPRVLVLTMHAEDALLLAALDAGASGYLLKSAAERELLDAIRALAKGGVYVQPAAARVLASRARPREAGEDQRRLLATLSEGEREVLRLLAEGHSAAVIAERLAINPKLVEAFRHRLSEKLGITGRPAFVRFALQAGLLLTRPTERAIAAAGASAPSVPLPPMAR